MLKDNQQLPPLADRSSGKLKRKILPIILALSVTIGLLYIMFLFKPKDEKKDDVKTMPTVETIQIDAIDYVIPIKSDGLVLAKIQINISAEITGKIIYVSDKFTNGGTFAKDDVLLKIDPIDYQLAITRAQANVAAQQANLDLQQAKSDLAKKDWQKYGKKGTANALNLNLPQVSSAKAALSGAQADLKLAQRNLDKSIVTAPFAGVILTKNVDLGQFLSIATPLASIAATDVAEIRISLSDAQLHDSGLDDFTPASNIKVSITSQEVNDIQWQGKISAIEAQRDMQTLFNYAIVEVDKPFTQQSTPLRFNTFVEVKLAGNTLKGVYPIERGYVTLDKTVKILSDQSTLELRKVEIIYASKDYFYISNGISTNDKIIITGLANVNAGDKLKLTKPATK
ncbi:MAG: efflux RND transporter periplasmic adaptor subunit [Proteobacteria bacterium]|nr:efflux RND transporter periplasmic adaptor subunit [Pseudomonadota bacterium]